MRRQVNLIVMKRPSRLSQAIPAVTEKQVIEVKLDNRRTNKARLLPGGSAERKLERLGNMFAEAFNELNYIRRDLFW
ncbi:MAG: hypothetical protein ACP5LF_04455 [Nitrososphaeria archaeon]